MAQHLSQDQYKTLFEGARTVGEGWKIPPIPAEVFNVNASDRQWVNQQCTMHPIECFRERIQLTGGIHNIKNVTFILARGWDGNSPFPPFYEEAKARGWKTLPLECGHDVMLDMPEELTKALLEAI